MRTLRRLLIPCWCLLLLPAGAAVRSAAAETPPARSHKAPKRATRAIIEKLEEQWREAQLAGDVNAMDRLLSDDYVGITAAGQVNTKALQLERVRNRSVTFAQLDPSDVKIKVAGKVAIVTSLFKVSGTADAKPLLGIFRSTRVYQQQPAGTWQITSFEATRVLPASGGVRRGDSQETDTSSGGAQSR